MTSDIISGLTTTPLNPIRWIQVGKLLDSRNSCVHSDIHLIYDQKSILYVNSLPPDPQKFNLSRTTPHLTLEDYFILPGLIEGHSHVFLKGDELNADLRNQYQKQAADTLLDIAIKRAEILARMGIVAMRDGGDKDGVGLRLSKLTKDLGESRLMSQVFSPGSGINRQGRYGSFFSEPVENFADIDSCVMQRIQAGADHIKIVPTGIINFAKGAVTVAPQFSADDIKSFKVSSLKMNRHLMAHASGDVGIGNAIDGGVDTVEHGFFITDEQLMKMRDKQISWVPTFTPVQEQVDHADVMGWSGEVLDNLKKILNSHACSLQRALSLGVNILVGSDSGSCGVSHGSGLIYEMELLEKAGMSPLQTLCQATYGNRRLLFDCPPIGLLESGYRTRFILTKHDPTISVKNLYQDRTVIFDGIAYQTSEISKQELNQLL